MYFKNVNLDSDPLQKCKSMSFDSFYNCSKHFDSLSLTLLHSFQISRTVE